MQCLLAGFDGKAGIVAFLEIAEVEFPFLEDEVLARRLDVVNGFRPFAFDQARAQAVGFKLAACVREVRILEPEG